MPTAPANSRLHPKLTAPKRGSRRASWLGLEPWQLAVVAGVGAYVFLAVQLFGIAFRYLSLGAILIGLAASGRTQAKRFLHDWFPLLLFWVGYDWLRDYADEIMPRVAVAVPYQLELRLFGWLTKGRVLAVYFLEILADSPWRPAVASLAEGFYWSHFVVIPGYMLWLWWKPPTSAHFRQFIYGITLLHLMTLATYLLYPAAPPWYVFHFGFQQPTPALLKDPTFLQGPVFFHRFWAANPNWFAAIPSLHGAYPIFLFLMVEPTWRTRGRVALYAAGVWLATVVLGHHYIIDLALGALYACCSAWLVSRLTNRVPRPAVGLSGEAIKERINH